MILNNISERIITIKDVTKKFGEIGAVNNVSLSIKKGEFVTLLGPSGCGKTTLLRMIAGFDAPSSGTITFNDIDLKDIPPHLRSVNTVFQRYALFPHLNVYNNIAFGLKLKKVPKNITQKDGTGVEKLVKYTSEEIDKKVKGALKLVELSGYEHRDVNSLSGGQQQRVAIARAIVNEPQVLLLDEPLGALDLKMRKEMQLELKEMHKKLGITFIYVTHDQEEALTMSDTIVVMKNGIIHQIGTGLEIYNEPVNAFVANFIGESNILNGKVTSENQITFDKKTFECQTSSFKIGQSVDVVIRPEDIVIKKVDQEKIDSGRYFEGTVVSSVFKGTYYEMGVKSKNGCEYLVQSTSRFDADDQAMLRIESSLIHLMKKEGSSNRYVTTLKNNENVSIFDTNIPCDISQLPGVLKNENGDFVSENQEHLDLSGKDVIASIENKDIILYDHDSQGQFSGEIVSILFKGDHYYLEIKTDYNQFFFVETNDIWDDGDRVGIELPQEKIKLKFPEIEDL